MQQSLRQSNVETACNSDYSHSVKPTLLLKFMLKHFVQFVCPCKQYCKKILKPVFPHRIPYILQAPTYLLSSLGIRVLPCVCPFYHRPDQCQTFTWQWGKHTTAALIHKHTVKS